jgi:hypothetical protein
VTNHKRGVNSRYQLVTLGNIPDSEGEFAEGHREPVRWIGTYTAAAGGQRDEMPSAPVNVRGGR